jgi:hypothetical protein
MVVEMARHRSLPGGHVQLSYLAATGWYRTLLLDKAGADRESRHPVHRMVRPATNPFSDIVKCQSTLPPAVCRSASAIGAVNVVSMFCGVSAVDMIVSLQSISYGSTVGGS